ncbi:hypothetical protein GmHk_04G011422 [Glycine max]|uniref:F-box domain-containing protein n=2 Tax=Glycine subgen. Soja TaxID=1462606 RepID=A0A0R0KGV7_SOYBN|nr:hypothetical protein JHK85_011121 [Glycine max]KAG5067080.1 hypothetical protein JHK86_010811 [Glycine max]KAH1255168.1 hypothetical protein GmHk_04G011422 [Glycine max]RZC17409.1 hypothetical protein D0Y65_010276 [Glycine soja]
MPFSKCWKWILKFMQSFFKTSSPCASPPPPPVELCNDALFEIFLRLPPEVLPRFSTLNKQSNEIINSPLFQTTPVPTLGSSNGHVPCFSTITWNRMLSRFISKVLISREYNEIAIQAVGSKVLRAAR